MEKSFLLIVSYSGPPRFNDKSCFLHGPMFSCLLAENIETAIAGLFLRVHALRLNPCFTTMGWDTRYAQASPALVI